MLTAEQLEARKNHIGGSDAAAVVGISPYKTPLQLWLEKSGNEVDQEENEAMEWGNRLEDAIAQAWSEKTGMKIRRQPMRVSSEHPFMAVHVDRQVLGDPRGAGYLEIKNFGHFSTGYDNEEQAVADYVQVQCLHGLAVTGWKWSPWAVLVGGQKFYHGEVERDQEAIDFLIDAEREFWRMVKEGIQPLADGSPRTVAFLNKLFPQSSGEKIVLSDPYIIDLARDLGVVRSQLKQLEERKEQLNNTFRLIMKENSVLEIQGWGGIEWKTSSPKAKTIFLEDDFAKAHPELYKEFSKKIQPKGDRRLTFHEGKDYTPKVGRARKDLLP